MSLADRNRVFNPPEDKFEPGDDRAVFYSGLIGKPVHTYYKPHSKETWARILFEGWIYIMPDELLSESSIAAPCRSTENLLALTCQETTL